MKKIILILIIAFLFLKMNSQIAIDTSYFYLDSVSNLYMPKQKVHINEILINNSNVFKTTQTYGFQKGSEFTFYGLKYTRFDQYFNGIKIEGNSYFITSKLDTIQNIGGKVLMNQLPPVSSLISTLTAIQSLTNSLYCYKYKWQDTLWEANIKDTKGDSLATYFPKMQLTIFKNTSYDYNNINEYYYAFPIYISALKSINDSVYFDSLYYVSAINGNIVKRICPIETSFSNRAESDKNHDIAFDNSSNTLPSSQNTNASSCDNSCKSGGVTVHYYGGQNINTAEFKYLGICTNRTKNDCNGATIYTRRRGNSNYEDYRSTNNSWPNQNDKVGITGHWCLEKTYEAYKNLFGFNSFDNNFSQVNALIDNQGQSLWKDDESVIMIGKFQNTSSYQAVLDIVGHEYGHGVMIHSSGLQGGMDLSSLQALNISATKAAVSEGFADILGQLVEFYVNSNYSTTGAINDFLHGGNNTNGIVPGQTRSLINPSQTNNPTTLFGSNYHAPLTLANNQNDFDDFSHQNATILGHWYFLLSQGGTGTNDNNDNFCVKALGQTKAGNITFLAATNFIGNYNKDFYGARLATIQAAVQLFGANSDEVAQTTEAWYAVGVGPKYNGQINIQNITVNTPGVIDIHYNSKININNVIVNNGNSSPTTFYVSSNTEIEMLPNVDFNQGVFAELYIAPPNPCSSGARLGNTNGNSDSNIESEFNENSATKIDRASEYYKELVFSIIPNPNNGNFKLILNTNNELPKSIIICNTQGQVVKTISNPNQYEYSLSLNELNSGLYVINAFYNDKTISKRFIKN